MNRRTLLATIVALLTMPGVALAASGPVVSVRVEGLNRTLLSPRIVQTHRGWITRYGAPAGECPSRSAQGALNVATHRRWHGTWSTEFGPEYEITSILGETHRFTSRYFWEIFAGNIPASTGACELKLHQGERLTFAVVPQSGNAYPTAIIAPRDVAAGHTFTVEVVSFNAQGRSEPLAGARVTGGGMNATTNSSGAATFTAPASGTLVLRAHHRWSATTAYIRAAPVTVHVS